MGWTGSFAVSSLSFWSLMRPSQPFLSVISTWVFGLSGIEHDWTHAHPCVDLNEDLTVDWAQIRTIPKTLGWVLSNQVYSYPLHPHMCHVAIYSTPTPPNPHSISFYVQYYMNWQQSLKMRPQLSHPPTLYPCSCRYLNLSTWPLVLSPIYLTQRLTQTLSDVIAD